jgi:hypothetical protein
MTRIETTVTVGDDRVVTLQLPCDVAPGEHKVTVIVDGSESEEIEQPLIREGNVLVFAGKRVGDVESVLDDVREERMQKLLRDAEG